MHIGRVLTETQSGLGSLAPDTAIDGDIVCILSHCPVPAIVWQQQNQYVLIGECYLDEFSKESDEDGEMVEFSWDKLAQERAEDTLLNIR